MMAEGVLRRPAWPRLSMGGTAAFVVGVLFLAGAVHIATILLVPAFARSDGWSRLAAVAGENAFEVIPVLGASSPRVAGLDPLFVNAACRLRLDTAPAAIAVEAGGRFWSLALYDPRGVILFSLNDRTAAGARLDMVVVNPAQNAELRASRVAELEQTIVVESPSDDLIALLRLFAPNEAAREDARAILTAAECVPESLSE